MENRTTDDKLHSRGSETLALLAQGQVPLWTAILDDVAAARLQELSQFLSPDEHQRAVRFRFQRDRNRFIACRGVLREILGACLRKDPAGIYFDYGCQGKPYLKCENGSTPLYFNVSHSDGCAIYALGMGELGVDLELISCIPEMQDLVDRNFSLAERIAFQSIPPELRTKAFFSCWTRKEAYVKACGDGLFIPLHQFDVSLDPSSPALLLRVQGQTSEEVPWSLHSFELSSDAVAALVCPKELKPHLCGTWHH